MPETNTVSSVHFIAFQNAIEMTDRYRENYQQIIKEEYQEAMPLCKSETFYCQEVVDMLAADGCEALRIYYGMDKNMKVHAILVGVDADGNDILPAGMTRQNASSFTNNGELLEEATRCPNVCPPPSVLNSDD